MSVNRFFIEASYTSVQERSAARTRPVVVVDKNCAGAWPKMPSSTFSQSRGRISSLQKFSVVDL